MSNNACLGIGQSIFVMYYALITAKGLSQYLLGYGMLKGDPTKSFKEIARIICPMGPGLNRLMSLWFLRERAGVISNISIVRSWVMLDANLGVGCQMSVRIMRMLRKN